MSDYGSCACWGHCLAINEETVSALNLTIKDLLEWYHHEDFEDEMKEIGECTTFLSALDKAIYHFGTGETAKIKVGDDVIEAVIYRYDPDRGGTDDDLAEGLFFDFNEADLYKKEPLPAVIKLREFGCEPQFSTWVSTS